MLIFPLGQLYAYSLIARNRRASSHGGILCHGVSPYIFPAGVRRPAALLRPSFALPAAVSRAAPRAQSRGAYVKHILPHSVLHILHGASQSAHSFRAHAEPSQQLLLHRILDVIAEILQYLKQRIKIPFIVLNKGQAGRNAGSGGILIQLRKLHAHRKHIIRRYAAYNVLRFLILAVFFVIVIVILGEVFLRHRKQSLLRSVRAAFRIHFRGVFIIAAVRRAALTVFIGIIRLLKQLVRLLRRYLAVCQPVQNVQHSFFLCIVFHIAAPRFNKISPFYSAALLFP